MATYRPDQLGIKPPSGGFQEGGWYSGRQYVGGTLSDPGVIHPNSPQQGAGQAVSKTVVAQTNPKNVAYVDAERKKANLNPLSNAPAQPNMPGGSFDPSASNAGLGQGVGVTPSINLPELYNSLTKDSGIQASEQQLSQMEKDFIEAQGKINDNPFLSEATRIGRVAKLDDLYQKRTANLRSDIATKKADIEMQLNLRTKQFDIESDQAKEALARFNALLDSGALSNASGDDIAAITRTTGLSSNMIRSAIQANNAKNIKTQTIQYDDGVNQGFTIINAETGEIISSQTVASSKPTKSSGGGSGSTSNLTASQKKTLTSSARKAVTKAGGKDKLISAKEYIDAVNAIMVGSSVDQNTADSYASTALSDLGYKKWKW